MPTRAIGAVLFGVALAHAVVACGVGSAPPVDTESTVRAPADASVDSTTDASVVATSDASSDAPASEASSEAGDASSLDGAVEAAVCVYPPAPPSSAAVLQFHKNSSRDGVYVDPAFTSAKAANVQLRLSAPLTGQIYAQPLYAPNGPGGREIFIAATEANHVTAVDGCGVQVWDRTYGSPAAYADLPCGNIYPTLGITGTPVIDATARIVYFDAMTQTGVGSAALRHMIHAVSLDDGSEKPGWPVDVQAAVPGFVSSNQNERGALTLVGGVLYVPYGGHFGDCAQYYGWVVGVPVTAPASVTAWRTIGGNPWDAGPPISGAGFWAAGGLPTDGTSIFAISGNAMDQPGTYSETPTWMGGEAVFRLGSGPTFSGQPSDYFYPSSWRTYDLEDQDMGGANAVLFGMGGSQYLLAMDKIGTVYVLDPANLGGDGGALLTYSLSDNFCGGSCRVVGAPIVYTTAQGTYVEVPISGETQFLLLSGNPLQVALTSLRTYHAAAIVTTPDGSSDFVVWTASRADGLLTLPGILYAMDGTTGAPLASVTTPDFAHYFNPPIAANGRIVATACGACFGPPGGEFPPPDPGNGQLLFFY